MRSQITKQSAPAIAVFHPGNSLMHQVSNWAIRHPDYEFALSFAQSLHEIRSVLRRSAISVVDATEDPGLAMTVFVQVMTALEADCVAVYTETVHDGLELFVRVRGVPLLLGPMSDAPWEDQLEKMLRAAGQMHGVGCLAQRNTETDGGLPKAWLREHRLQTSLIKRPHKFFQKRR